MHFFRFILALNVMIFHVLLIPKIGSLAVYSFFILSGFLMTTIMKERYGYNIFGFKCFITNRFLKLFPIYWFLIIITVVIIFVIGEEFINLYNSSFGFPTDLYNFLSNLSLIYLNIEPMREGPRLSPSSWALTIELFFYILIGLGLSKNKHITICWVSVSILYWIYQSINQGVLYTGYGDILSASFPFSIGGLIYYYKNQIKRIIEKYLWNPLTSMSIVFGVNVIACALLSNYGSMGTYINMLVTSFMLVLLYFKKTPIFSMRLDSYLGDLSYPIYIFHWTAACLSAWIIVGEPVKELSVVGLVIFLFALVICIFVSTIANYLVNNPADKVRNIIKSQVKI